MDPQILKWVAWTSNNSGAKIKIWSKSPIREKCKDLQQWRRYSGREVFGLLMKVSILWWMALAESAARSGREHSATGFQAEAREPHLLMITKVHNPSPNHALFLTHCNALPFSALLFRTLVVGYSWRSIHFKKGRRCSSILIKWPTPPIVGDAHLIKGLDHEVHNVKPLLWNIVRI